MKSALSLFLLLVCLAGADSARRGLLLSGRAPSGGGAAPTYLIEEYFEGTGYDHPTWTEILGGGLVNEDNTTIVLDGAQSLRVTNANGGNLSYAYKGFTARGECFAYCKFFPNANTSGNKEFFKLADNLGNTLASVTLLSSGALRVSNVVQSNTTVSTLTLGQGYGVWLYYATNSGGFRTASVGFDPSLIRPTSGNQFAQITTTAASATAIAEIHVGVTGGDFSDGADFIFDRVLMDDVQIGDNP